MRTPFSTKYETVRKYEFYHEFFRSFRKISYFVSLFSEFDRSRFPNDIDFNRAGILQILLDFFGNVFVASRAEDKSVGNCDCFLFSQ